MGDFSKLSNFNPNANFKSVRIGSDCPVLEVELNEMQDISENQMMRFINHYLGEGVRGEGEYQYSGNTLTIKNENAIVNGRLIFITELKLTIKEGEKAYLKVWEEEVTHEDIIKYEGNQQEKKTIPNHLRDERIGLETSRRIQVKYDIVKSNGADEKDYLYLGKVLNDKFLLETKILAEGNNVIVDTFNIEGTTRVFSTSKLYKTGVNALSVYINGSYKIPTVDYVETSNNTFTLTTPVDNGDIVVAVYQKMVTSSPVVKEGHSSKHAKYGEDVLDIQDLGDRENLLLKIIKRLELKTIDGGYFKDFINPNSEIFDGGLF